MTTTRGAIVGAIAMGLVGSWVVSVPPAGAVPVSTEAELKTAFADAAVTSIELANSIDLVDCTADPDLERNNATPLTVVGNGATIRQTCPDANVVTVNLSHLTLDGVTITGGQATGSSGGGIFTTGDLTLIDAVVSGNTAENGGGGIHAAVGNLTIESSAVSGNTAGGDGGGILAQGGAVTITDSSLSLNEAGTDGFGGGGALFRDAGGGAAVTITRSTIADNTSRGGGAVTVLQDLVVVNSTVTGNSTDDGPNLTGENLTLRYVTAVRNSAPDDANVGTVGTFDSFGSVVALPLGGGGNCFIHPAGTAASSGYNRSDDDTCSFDSPTDQQNTGDPQLGALAGNGGPTGTLLPLAGSLLLDAIPLDACAFDGITQDQRGVTRPQGGGCDTGAVEIEVGGSPGGRPEAPPATPVPGQPRFTG